jgi:hypothetical protein
MTEQIDYPPPPESQSLWSNHFVVFQCVQNCTKGNSPGNILVHSIHRLLIYK